MRLREYIDNSMDQEDPKYLLIRAIDSIDSIPGLNQAAALIASLSPKLNNHDLMFVQQYFEKAAGKMETIRTRSGGMSTLPKPK